MRLRVKDYLHVFQHDIDLQQRRDAKEFDRIANVCLLRATDALKMPSGTYTQMQRDQMGDIFRSMLATQRGIRRMLDFEGPIDSESVDALLLARVQLEGLYAFCLMLEDPSYVTTYVQDHWRKQYVKHLTIREETKLLPKFGPLHEVDLRRLINLGNLFGINPDHFHTVDKEELGITLPLGVRERAIRPFPTPGKAIQKIKSSPEKKRMLERLYAKYTDLCSFSHSLPQANLLKNVMDKRFPDRRMIKDSEIRKSYQADVVGEAYYTSFMSIAQCTAELTVLYPDDVELAQAAGRAWNELAEASFLSMAIWEIRAKKLLRVV